MPCSDTLNASSSFWSRLFHGPPCALFYPGIVPFAGPHCKLLPYKQPSSTPNPLRPMSITVAGPARLIHASFRNSSLRYALIALSRISWASSRPAVVRMSKEPIKPSPHCKNSYRPSIIVDHDGLGCLGDSVGGGLSRLSWQLLWLAYILQCLLAPQVRPAWWPSASHAS